MCTDVFVYIVAVVLDGIMMIPTEDRMEEIDSVAGVPVEADTYFVSTEAVPKAVDNRVFL